MISFDRQKRQVGWEEREQCCGVIDGLQVSRISLSDVAEATVARIAKLRWQARLFSHVRTDVLPGCLSQTSSSELVQKGLGRETICIADITGTTTAEMQDCCYRSRHNDYLLLCECLSATSFRWSKSPVSLHRRPNSESSLARRAEGVSYSNTLPCESTSTRSKSMIVCRRSALRIS